MIFFFFFFFYYPFLNILLICFILFIAFLFLFFRGTDSGKGTLCLFCVPIKKKKKKFTDHSINQKSQNTEKAQIRNQSSASENVTDCDVVKWSKWLLYRLPIISQQQQNAIQHLKIKLYKILYKII